jgi:hypothetical protein
VVGTTRQARLVTLGTVAAVVVAIAAFVALEPADDDSIPRDSYTIAADHMCLLAKRQIVAAGRSSPGDPGRFARALVPVIATWRSGFRALRVPADRLEKARSLDAVLRDVEIEVARLALTAEQGNRSRTLAQAKKVDLATTQVEQAISDLGLGQCARARIGLSTRNTG